MLHAQDWIKTGTGLGVEKVRLAASDFKASTADAKNADLLKTFNDTLWNDLDNAGIFDMVSKSFYPLGAVGAPADVKFEGWSAPPPTPRCWLSGILEFPAIASPCRVGLYDVKNITSPQVLGKQYQDVPTSECRTDDCPQICRRNYLSFGWRLCPALQKPKFIL